MSPPISDQDLTRWAREHLVYEARMLAFTAIRLAERHGIPRNPESNALLESFVVHVRCLRDFLWGDRNDRQPMDAFATDFCEEGKWESERGAVPPAITEIDERNRAGREVVHLSYHRLGVEAAAKDWEVSEVYMEIEAALAKFAILALPSRLDDKTREALQEPMEHDSAVGPASVATGATYGLAVRGGTVEFPGFHAGS
jgi:hypothetical protein